MAERFPSSGHYTFDSAGSGDVALFLFTDPVATDATLPQAANTARRWCHDTNDTTSADVGPTSGEGGSPDGYLYTEMSSTGAFNDVFWIEFEDSASLGNPYNFDASTLDWEVQFSTNQRGDDNTGAMQVYTNENGAGWVARGSDFGGGDVATAGTQIWRQRSTDLTGLISHASTRIALRITQPASGTTWHNDAAFDRIAFIGTDQISNEIDGITYDDAGSALGSCICTLYKDNGDDTITYYDRVTSNASTGAFTFSAIGSADASFFIVATKADTPAVADVSERTIQPAVSYTGTVDLYLRSQVDKSETAGDGDLRLRSQASKETTAYTMDAAAAAYTWTGTAASVEYHSLVSAAAAAYTWTGQPAALLRDSVLHPPESASYLWQDEFFSAVTFDGTNDYLSRGADLTGNADGKVGTASLWVKMNGGNGTQQVIASTSDLGFLVQRAADNTLQVALYNAANDLIGFVGSTSTVTDATGWVHVLASWDLGNSLIDLYLNDVDETTSPFTVDDTIDYTDTDHSVGSIGGFLLLDGCLREVYLNFAEYVDITDAAERAKFGIGLLGSDGSTPTGTAPIAFFRNPPDSFETNLGTGGDYSVTGQLTGCGQTQLIFASVLSAEAAAYTWTGQDATLEYHTVLVAEAASYTWTGQTASLELGSVLTAEAAAYTWTGQAATLTYVAAATLDAEPAAYTWTGTAANLEYHSLLLAEPAAYTWTGTAAVLTYDSLLTADAAAYAWTGQDTGLVHDAILSAEAAAYTWTGQDAGLIYSIVLSAETATYVWTGQTATLIFDAMLSAEAGAYTWTGQDATLTYLAGFGIIADPAAYTWTGTEAALLYDSVVSAGAASYVWTGADATLTHTIPAAGPTDNFKGMMKNLGQMGRR